MRMEYKEFLLSLLIIGILFLKDYILLNNHDNYKAFIKRVYSDELKIQLEDYNTLLKINNLSNKYHIKCIVRPKKVENNNYYKYLFVFKTNNCNIKKDDIVLNENGLIGIIDKIKDKNARVMLISNSKMNLSVKVNDEYGILKSKKGSFYVEDIVNINETKTPIYTSGLTNIPNGIYVGDLIKNNNDYIVQIPKSNNSLLAVLGD